MIGKEIIDLLNTALNPRNTPSGREVLVVALKAEFDPSNYAVVIVDATTGDSLSELGRVSGIYSGSIVVGIAANDYDTADAVGNTIRDTLHGFAGPLGSRYNVLAISVSPETQNRNVDDELNNITQTYDAMWYVSDQLED